MHRYGRICFASLVLSVLGELATAAEWKVTGKMDQGIEYDDNIAMRADATPAIGYLLRPNLSANWNTKTMTLGISGNGDVRRYDDSRWDCENFSIRLDQRYLQPRNVFSLDGGYAQSCSYSQQISDTGILVPGNQSENYNFAPAWSWQWTRRDRISLRPSYSETSYSSGGSANTAGTGANFSSNKSYSLDLSDKHDWNRRLSVNGGVSFSHSEFSSAGNASSQHVFGFQLGGEYTISHAWSISAGGGGRWVQRPSSPVSAYGNGGDSPIFAEIANLALNYKGRSMDYSFAFSRSVNPSAFGQLLEYNSVKTKYSYQITRELSFNIEGSVQKSQSIGQGTSLSIPDRTYYTASTGIVWKFAKEWQLSANYRYRRQEYSKAQEAQTADVFADMRESNALMLHLNYNWDGWRLSR